MRDLAWFVLPVLHSCPGNWICMIKLGYFHVCMGHHILPVETNLGLFMAPFCGWSKFHSHVCCLQKKDSAALVNIFGQSPWTSWYGVMQKWRHQEKCGEGFEISVWYPCGSYSSKLLILQDIKASLKLQTRGLFQRFILGSFAYFTSATA